MPFFDPATLHCNGCTACCRGPGRVMLHPALGDDPRHYEADIIPDVGAALKRRADGDCIYLGETGCTIYHRRPAVCRAFDCRAYVTSPWAKMDPLADKDIRQAAAERM